jgi:sensor domain CHASE-containing protein
MLAGLAALVVVISATVSVVMWLAVRPSEDKVRSIVKEELSKAVGTLHADVQLIKEILLKR